MTLPAVNPSPAVWANQRMTALAEHLAPTTALAGEIAARVLGRIPRCVDRFRTGARHYVFDVEFDSEAPVVVRLGDRDARAELAGAVHLSRLLRPLASPCRR